MAILRTIKEKAASGLMTAADKGANLVAKASGLSSAQLQNIEERRQKFMNEKPDTDPEGIKRLLGSYAIEAYEAYLPQIAALYEPIHIEIGNDERSLINRIRYFEITKWITDPSENSLEKLINVYQVVSRDACNIALIYNRKKNGCKVYLAIVSNDSEDKPQIVDVLEDRIISAMKGNFPGVEFKQRDKDTRERNLYGLGVLPCLEKTDNFSVASVSNIATEKTEDFLNQSMEKLLDGICPKDEKEEYTIVMLATPIMEQFERKNALSELYSKLAPYAGWQTNFTYSEHMAEGSSAAFGASLGASASMQSGNAYTNGVSSSQSQGLSEGHTHTDSKTVTNTDTVGTGVSSSASVGVSGGGVNASASNSVSAHYDHSRAVAKGSSDALSKVKTVTDVIGKMSSVSQNTGLNLGVNVGANFSRSSNVSVTIGKNEGLTQTFVNHGIKYTLELIEKQIKRLEESSALGMWDFSAYFLSESPVIANNAAHMYLALTQGNDSYLSQSAVNLWVPPINANHKDAKKNEEIQKKRQDVTDIIDFIKRLQHPQFQLREFENDEWLMYPPHINATVSLTGRELARSLNFPKKSVSGMPVIECVAFGREVHKYEIDDSEEDVISFGHVYHMHHDENADVMLDINSLTSHTFITGSTGTGKSNTVYQLINKIQDKDIHFMVIEPAKGEYKEWLGANCHVYGTNSHETDLLYINPFSFPEKIHILEHIDRLVEILNACWPMYAAMPAVLKDSIERIYVNKGWNLRKSVCCIEGTGKFPTFSDLLLTLPEVMEESLYSADTKSDYSGALMTRIKSLTNGLNGQILCSGVETSEKDLFEENVIVDLSRIGSMETRSFFMGILVMKLQEYHMNRKAGTDAKLKHLTVIEEAHNLLRRTSMEQSQESANLQGKSVEMLTNSIAEMRTYGEGFVIVDQAPGLLDEAVIRNTNTKIILRLPDADDREVAGKAAALKDDQIEEIAKLPKGVAVIYQNNWVEAVLCHFDKFEDKSPYSKPQEVKLLPQEIFCRDVFKEGGFKELRGEVVDSVFAWIESSKYARETKRIMKKALYQEKLSERERHLIAYNVFEGKTIAKLLSGALTEEEGIDKANKFVRSNYELKDDILVETVCRMIIQVIIDQNDSSELAKRYAEYSGRIK